MVRTRDIQRRRGVRGPLEGGREPPSTPFIDRDFSYYRNGSRWSFEDGKILLDGYDINQLISQPTTEISVWLGVAGGLDDYRKKILAAAREQDQFSRFEAVVEALLGKVLGRLKKVYDQKTTGLAWSIEKGQLILNGINVRSFLALYRVKKTEKAEKFLEGLKNKLVLLLESPEHEKIRPLAQEVYQEISETLGDTKASRPARPLPPHRSGGS